MKRTLALITFVSFMFSSNVALASSFKAKCLDRDAEFSDCTVNVGADQLQITYESSKNQALNINVHREQITGLSRQEYTKHGGRSIAGIAGTAGSIVGMVLPPLGLLGGLVGLSSQKKERTYEQIGLEYVVEQNDKAITKALVIDIKQTKGFALKQELKALTGLEFNQ